MYYIIAQLVGVVAMLLCIGSFQCKNGKSLLLMQLIGNGIYIIHFLMLGAISGCLSVLVVVLGNGVLCMRHKAWARWRGWKWLVCASLVLACVLTWESPVSLLPCAGSMVLMLTNWSYNVKAMRIGKIVFVGPAWIVYNLLVHSYSGLLSESFGVVSSLIALYRYGKQEKTAEGEIAGSEE